MDPVCRWQILRQLKRLQMGASEQQAEAIHGQKVALQLNLAAVHFRMEEYAEAIKVATEVRATRVAKGLPTRAPIAVNLISAY